MALNANKVAGAGPKATPLAPDNYPARVVQIIDLGVQNQRPYKGVEKPPINEIMVTYELTSEFMLDDEGNEDKERPRWVSERMAFHNLRADKAKSTKRYMALDPKGECEGDFTQLVGRPCLVAIVNNEKDGRVYNNVGAVSPPVKGMDIPGLVNEGKVFDLDSATAEDFAALPEWIQGIIRDGLTALPFETETEEAAEEDEADLPY